MRRHLALIILPVLLLSGSALARPVAAQTAAPAASAFDKAPWWMKDNVITQTGYVFSETPANRASFSGTFLTTDADADKAQAKAIDQTRALQQALAKLGKDAVRVTTSFSMRTLYQEYKDKDGNRIEDQRADKINGYQVSLNISLEVRDMSVLENAYALLLAASPTLTTDINFDLQPTNEMNTWLYTQAVKDAHTRAGQAANAAGGRLGGIKVIDPTGRACQTDILARGAPEQNVVDGITAQDIGAFPDRSVSEGLQRVASVSADMAEPAPAPPSPEEQLEAKALKNPFVQTPPLQRLTATACVVYGLE